MSLENVSSSISDQRSGVRDSHKIEIVTNPTEEHISLHASRKTKNEATVKENGDGNDGHKDSVINVDDHDTHRAGAVNSSIDNESDVASRGSSVKLRRTDSKDPNVKNVL